VHEDVSALALPNAWAMLGFYVRGFTLLFKIKETPKLSNSLGWEHNFGPKEFTILKKSESMNEKLKWC
jgi:hypothetical protein